MLQTLSMQEQIEQDFFHAFNRRDITTMKNLYADDALVHSAEGPEYGPQSIEDIVNKWLQVFPDLKGTILHSSVEGDVVIIHWKCEGTRAKLCNENSNAGNRVSFHGLTCFRCKNGKVVEHWASVDYRPIELF